MLDGWHISVGGVREESQLCVLAEEELDTSMGLVDVVAAHECLETKGLGLGADLGKHHLILFA
jgi:hypothetical protein